MVDSIKKKARYTQMQMAVGLAIAFGCGILGGVVISAFQMADHTVTPAADGEPDAGVVRMVAALEAQTRDNPEQPELWIQLGNLYFDTHAYQQAISAYQRALSLGYRNAGLLTDLGVMYRRSGQPLRAVDAFDQAIAVDDKHATARFNKGIVLMYDLKERERAIQVWRDLAELHPLFTAPNGQSLDEILRHFEEHEP